VTKVPSLPYPAVLRALQRAGWVIVRQRGSHIRLQRREEGGELLKIIVPAHKPIKRSTLARILKDARLSVEDLSKLL
jgi:predicted RNA binding protein YcfA (HicA-like mRNA interferase family)